MIVVVAVAVIVFVVVGVLVLVMNVVIVVVVVVMHMMMLLLYVAGGRVYGNFVSGGCCCGTCLSFKRGGLGFCCDSRGNDSHRDSNGGDDQSRIQHLMIML